MLIKLNTEYKRKINIVVKEEYVCPTVQSDIAFDAEET